MHCGLSIPPVRTWSEFCCAGCEVVHKNILSLGLEEFYRLQNQKSFTTTKPPSPGKTHYESLDSPDVIERICIDRKADSLQVLLHIEGIHCAGCVWLLERLPSVLTGVLESRINVATGQLTVRFRPSNVNLSEIARCLDSLGYEAHAMKSGAERGHDTSERDLLIRLGVAGFCAANSMMLAVSLYEGDISGMEPLYANFFRWVSLLLALPAVFFSAQPFYRGALQGLRFRVPQIDLPISIAIIAGFLLSGWNTFHRSTFTYYDSLTVLIFLLLAVSVSNGTYI